MDPLTHGLLGGVTAQALYRKKVTPAVTAAGVLGAMAPDLDIVLQSKANPLLLFEYHRHFTHSLAFIPIGGCLVGLLLWLLLRRRPPLRDLLLAAVAGYATHGLLDACTSYGTLLFWPFSRARVSWDLIFIVDPIFSLLLLAGLWVSLRRHRGGAALAALGAVIFYLSLGGLQHHRAAALQSKLAESRGQNPEKARVIPGPGPLLLWRSLYLSQGQLFVDVLRTGFDDPNIYWTGGTLPYFNVDRLTQELPEDSTLGRDLRTFAWFTEGFVARLAEAPLDLGDLRFSPLVGGLRPLWGIRVDPNQPGIHVQRLRFPWTGQDRWDGLWEMLRGRAAGAQRLSAGAFNKRLLGAPSEAMLGGLN